MISRTNSTLYLRRSSILRSTSAISAWRSSVVFSGGDACSTLPIARSWLTITRRLRASASSGSTGGPGGDPNARRAPARLDGPLGHAWLLGCLSTLAPPSPDQFGNDSEDQRSEEADYAAEKSAGSCAYPVWFVAPEGSGPHVLSIGPCSAYAQTTPMRIAKASLMDSIRTRVATRRTGLP